MCFQEMNRVDDFYGKELEKLGYTLIRSDLRRGVYKLENLIAISQDFELITSE